MEYLYREIEKKWQQWWTEHHVYKVTNNTQQPKYYVLDMFPYPSGAGLHVGHPLGYIASDIFARFKKLKGFNVLHPMGYDAFGLPAEQYAIEHGIHPAVSTEQNIQTFRKQLDNIGFCFDWSREVRTCDPSYYKWTQWIFLQLFHSFFNRHTQKAERIKKLISIFETEGNQNHACPGNEKLQFTAAEWKAMNAQQQHDVLMQYRLVYCGYGEVNWCEALGTVLANDEVVNGVSERGGYPVVKKKLRQWYLRITEYAERLLQGLQTVDFSEAMKEMQSNWIGKSYGAEINFDVKSDVFDTITDEQHRKLTVFTTRPDTIFGVDFMVLAPEHEMTELICSKEQKAEVEAYLSYVQSRNERERMAEKKVTGVFTGAYAINPFNQREIPIYISEYVLAGYGTGAIMGVPCGDERDFKFAQHFQIPITNILGELFNGKEANPTKDATLENSGFLTGMLMRDAMEIVLTDIEGYGIGKRKINYKMRDAAFSRQRYWGEPIPIVWKNSMAFPLDENQLPLELPYTNHYQPGKEGESPLAAINSWIEVSKKDWPSSLHTCANDEAVIKRESNTMPGYAGSSWYFLRYMDPHNEKEFCSRQACNYWQQVDLYVGGTEHAVGHLLYSRMWTKVLYDLGYIGFDEPYKKLVNQGMVLGSSRFVYRLVPVFETNLEEFATSLPPVFISESLYHEVLQDEQAAVHFWEMVAGKIPVVKQFHLTENVKEVKVIALHVDVNLVNGFELNAAAFRAWKPEYQNAILIGEDKTILMPEENSKESKYKCGYDIEKMSKSKFNTVNPDMIVEKYGADTFRMYEMFLGPVEQSKPWNTQGIEGIHRFLKKLWRLFFDEQKGKQWTNEQPLEAELRILHKALKKIEDDTERLSFNTAISAAMVCVNELTDINCHKREVLEPLLIALSPYAPHITEELWEQLGNTHSIVLAQFPGVQEMYIKENGKNYPVSINGKLRTTLYFSLDASEEEIQQTVCTNETIKKWLNGKEIKKFIFVKGKMINVVV